MRTVNGAQGAFQIFAVFEEFGWCTGLVLALQQSIRYKGLSSLQLPIEALRRAHSHSPTPARTPPHAHKRMPTHIVKVDLFAAKTNGADQSVQLHEQCDCTNLGCAGIHVGRPTSLHAHNEHTRQDAAKQISHGMTRPFTASVEAFGRILLNSMRERKSVVLLKALMLNGGNRIVAKALRLRSQYKSPRHQR